jgi:hypothetical protein
MPVGTCELQSENAEKMRHSSGFEGKRKCQLPKSLSWQIDSNQVVTVGCNQVGRNRFETVRIVEKPVKRNNRPFTLRRLAEHLRTQVAPFEWDPQFRAAARHPN